MQKKNVTFFKLFWYKVFVHWKLKLLNFLVDSVYLFSFVCLFVCFFWGGHFLLFLLLLLLLLFFNFGFKMFVLVLQLQSKINKTYQTHIRFKWENLFPGLSSWSVSIHLTGGLISKVSIRTNGANYTWFHLQFLSDSFQRWVPVRLQSIFVFTGEQTRMGTC